MPKALPVLLTCWRHILILKHNVKIPFLVKDGGTYTGDASKTGFNIRKFVNENLKTEAQWDFGKTETSFPIFRLAEVYLNLAEAAVEMGKYQTEAFEAIKKYGIGLEW